MADDLGPRRFCDGRRGIGRSVVYHEEFGLGQPRSQAFDHGTDSPGFIKGWYYNGHMIWRHGLAFFLYHSMVLFLSENPPRPTRNSTMLDPNFFHRRPTTHSTRVSSCRAKRFPQKDANTLPFMNESSRKKCETPAAGG
jgi:hypothetical protein